MVAAQHKHYSHETIKDSPYHVVFGMNSPAGIFPGDKIYCLHEDIEVICEQKPSLSVVDPRDDSHHQSTNQNSIQSSPTEGPKNCDFSKFDVKLKPIVQSEPNSAKVE